MEVIEGNKEGFKKTKIGWIPKDWVVKTLRECSRENPAYGINASAVAYSESLPRYVRITDINDNGMYSPEKKVSVDHVDSGKFILRQDDILFVRTGSTTGKSYLYNPNDGKLVYAGFLIKFSIDSSIVDPYYIKLFSETAKYLKWVSIMSIRSGQPGINGQEYASLHLPLPSKVEQLKIVRVIKSWDQAISETQKLIEQLKLRKKGLMQQLLTGKKRLSGFNDEAPLNRLKGLVFEKSERNKSLNVDRVLSVTNSRGFINQSEQFDRAVASKDLSNYKIVRKGQFAYNPSRVNVGSLDLLRNFDEGLLSPMYVIFETDEKKLVPEFLYYHLKSWWFTGHIPQFVQGSVRDSLSFDGLKSMSFFLPDIKEQKAIIDILATADKEIKSNELKLIELQSQKKGLMQQLLTGQKRVKI